MPVTSYHDLLVWQKAIDLVVDCYRLTSHFPRTETYGLAQPHPGWTEQDPALWWDGAQKSIRAVIAKAGADPASIRGVGLTGQMHGLVLLDEQLHQSDRFMAAEGLHARD